MQGRSSYVDGLTVSLLRARDPPRRCEVHRCEADARDDERWPQRAQLLSVALLTLNMPSTPLNVLLLVIDDLRPELATYGFPTVTPHLDAFASSALTFGRAYVQYSHCSPSRNSFLSGRSPQTTGVYNFIDHFRLPNVGANWTALPQYFKQAGHQSLGGGKVYHPEHPPHDDMPKSWDAYFKPNGDDEGCANTTQLYNNVCPSDKPNVSFYDGDLAAKTATQISQARTPWFIAAGLRRPHRPWHVPRWAYDFYANNGTDPLAIPVAKHKTGPKGMPELAYIQNVWPEGVDYDQDHPIPDRHAKQGRWGYYAATSFTDANVGLIIGAVDDAGLRPTTVVALLGDHGWQLGEHGEWCKRTNFELGVRIPLIIRSPAHPASAGWRTDALVEALDLYRTLASLSFGDAAPPIEAGVEGADLSGLFASANAAPAPGAPDPVEARSALRRAAGLHRPRQPRRLHAAEVRPRVQHDAGRGRRERVGDLVRRDTRATFCVT